MKKNLNPLSRANLSNTNLMRGFGVLSVGFFLSSLPPHSTGLHIASLVLLAAFAILFVTILYRLAVPCRVCNAGRDVPTDEAWTCPHCKINFKAAEPERKRDGAGPWE